MVYIRYKEDKTMKLSKAQIKAVEIAKADIDLARAYDSFEEYVIATLSFYKNRGVEYVRDHMDDLKFYKDAWEKERNGIVLSRAGKNTIEALVKMGIFTVVEYDVMRRQGVLDWVKLNNY